MSQQRINFCDDYLGPNPPNSPEAKAIIQNVGRKLHGERWGPAKALTPTELSKLRAELGRKTRKVTDAV